MARARRALPFLALLLVAAPSVVSADGPAPAKPAAAPAVAQSGKMTALRRTTITLGADEKNRVTAALSAATKQLALDNDARKAIATPSGFSANAQRVYAMASRRAVAQKSGKLPTKSAPIEPNLVATYVVIADWETTVGGCTMYVQLDMSFTNKGLGASPGAVVFAQPSGRIHDLTNNTAIPALQPQQTSPLLHTGRVRDGIDDSHGPCTSQARQVAYYLNTGGPDYLLEWSPGGFEFYESALH